VICLLGILSCAVLLSTFDTYNWALTLIWTIAGFALYFAYSYKHSKLH
jgi:APA family basic amino acid/polyamine antiporter